MDFGWETGYTRKRGKSCSSTPSREERAAAAHLQERRGGHAGDHYPAAGLLEVVDSLVTVGQVFLVWQLVELKEGSD